MRQAQSLLRFLHLVFPNVALPDWDTVRLSSDIVIPRREYERWQAGGAPQVFIEFVDAAGNPMRKYVELTRSPIGEEEE